MSASHEGITANDEFDRHILSDEEQQLKYEHEYDDARRKQAVLLEQLRGTGVVGVVEKATDRIILPLTDKKGDYIVRKPSQIDTLRIQEYIAKHETAERTNLWSLTFAGPRLYSDGEWNTDLRMILKRRHTTENPAIPHESVLVQYDRNDKVAIVGADVTYSGEGTLVDIPDVENALKSALQNPLKTYPDPFEVY